MEEEKRGCRAEACACGAFRPNPMRPHKCFGCYHDASEHDGLSHEDQARAALARPSGDCEPSVIEEGFLLMGGMRAAARPAALAAAGVTHVINCARGLAEVWPRFREYPDRFSYLRLEMDDSPGQPIEEAIGRAMAFMEAAQAEGGRVFVHCAQGVSRSGAVVVAWLMRTRGLDYDEALALARRGRVLCSPNSGFEAALRTWKERSNSLAE